MITYIDSSNKEKYTVLFQKASAKLGLAPIVKEVLQENGEIAYEYFKRVQVDGEWREVQLDPEVAEDKAFIDGETSKEITSLNEYFQHITELAQLAIGQGRAGSDPYFLRLPLDEPFLEINANTRVISVPSQLRQIGVRGDKYAEVVFFKIDRYYDAVDLATRHIYIEWEDAAGHKGVSRDFLKDTQSEKDKIIFGWIIGDELTEAVGNIRFAVRFVEWTSKEDSSVAPAEGRGLEYSFSSLPAQMSIVDSLNYSLFEDDEAAQMIDTEGQGSMMLFYLEDSDPDSADETAPEPAGVPVFVRNLRDILGAVEAEGIYEADLANGELELLVEASSISDSGNISYIFARKDELESGANGIVAKIKFIPVELANAAAAESDRVYYKKLENDTFEVVAVADLDFLDGPVTVYEKVAFAIVSQPGYYFAKARNSVNGKKASSADSDILYVPYASAPVIAKEMPERFVIREAEYSLVKNEAIDQSQMPGAQQSNIQVQAGEVGPAAITLGAAEVGPVFEAAKSAGLAYEWFKSEALDAEGHMVEPISINTAGPELEVTEPGYYAVKVVNSFNNDTEEIDKEAAGIIRVTNMPEIPEVLFEDWTKTVVSGDPSTKIEVAEPAAYDEVSYEWHMVTGDNADMDPIAEGYMADAAGKIEFTEGKGVIPFHPLAAGFYYFIVKNELNEASILMNSGEQFGTIYVATGSNAPVNPTPTPQPEPSDEPVQEVDGGEAGNGGKGQLDGGDQNG